MSMQIMINRRTSFNSDEIQVECEQNRVLRSNMQAKIRHFLQEMTKSDSDPRMQTSLGKLSKVFEAKLYKCAPSLDAYSDQNTLESRIRILAMQLGKRVEDNQKFSTEERRKALESRLGKALHRQVSDLVEKIKWIRCNSFHELRSKEESESGLPSCSGGSCLSLPKICSSKTGSSDIPLPMKEIYLNIRLMDAISMVYSAKSKESVLAYISTIRWDDLINDAIEKVSNFEFWKSQYMRNDYENGGC